MERGRTQRFMCGRKLFSETGIHLSEGDGRICLAFVCSIGGETAVHFMVIMYKMRVDFKNFFSGFFVCLP